MDARSRADSHREIGLPQWLLLATLAELVVYRLLVPVLRPRIDQGPPLWHAGLAYIGLFLFYFASALALGVVAHQLWQIAKRLDRFDRFVTPALLLAGGSCLLLALIAIVAPPSPAVTFFLEGSFVASVVLLILGQWRRRGDLGVALGLVLLAMPFFAHFYAPLSVRYIGGEEALFDGIVEKTTQAGRWLLLLAGITMPYFFGARPFLLRAARIGPLAAALVVVFLGGTLIRMDYATAMQLAQSGLGISLGPGVPSSLLGLSLLALAAVAWTFTNCVTAPSCQRRKIGIGLALIVVGGYAFSWPLQLLSGLSGFLTIARAASRVPAEERELPLTGVPSISDRAWQDYLNSVASGVAEQLRSAGTDVGEIPVLTAQGEGEHSRSHLVYEDESDSQNISVKITIERRAGAVVGIDFRCGGGDGEVLENPAWSLHCARADERGLVHPAPPEGPAPLSDGDIENYSELAEEFVICDDAGWSDVLLGEGRQTALAKAMPGWVACWPNGTLRAQIYPGRGATLHSPIPIVALAMESEPGNAEPRNAEALVHLVGLLVALARASHCQAGNRQASDCQASDAPTKSS